MPPLDLPYESLPNRSSRVQITYLVPCALTGAQVKQRFFGTVKSKRKSKVRPTSPITHTQTHTHTRTSLTMRPQAKSEVADYNIAFDNGTEATPSHPSTPCNPLVEDEDYFLPPFSAPLAQGTLVDGRFQGRNNWFRGRVGGYTPGEVRKVVFTGYYLPFTNSVRCF